jgi:hypothetical protein
MIETEVKNQMNPNYDFNGQVALVTGAAKGMGLAIANAYAPAHAGHYILEGQVGVRSTYAEGRVGTV